MKTMTNTIRQYFLMLTLVCVGAMTAQAATYTVNQLGDAGDGFCDATCTLRDAVTNANNSGANDVIDFAVTGTITLGGTQLQIANNGSLTINGPGADQLSISGNLQSRVFFMNGSTTVTINGITITKGYVDGGGGGIISFGTLTISDTVITQNAPTGFGGGLICVGLLTIENSTISFNTANNGGGIHIGGGTTKIINSTVSNNTSRFQAGGINNQGAALIITNSTISGNTSGSVGGAILLNGGTLTLTNATITENSAAGAGGGIFAGTPKANNTIIANNSAPNAPDVRATLNSQGYNLIGNTSGMTVTGDETGNIYNVNPLLGPLQDNGGSTFTHALLPGSPAIDAGNSTLTTDQRGFMRPVDIPSYPNAANGSDIGAFEYQGATPTNKDQCKNGGWMTFDFPRTFKNQGDCIQFVNTGK